MFQIFFCFHEKTFVPVLMVYKANSVCLWFAFSFFSQVLCTYTGLGAYEEP